MSSINIDSCCDLPVAGLNFKLDQSLIDSFPALNIALRAASSILSNKQLIENFAAHFIPYEDYKGRLPSSIPESIMQQMKDTFTVKNIPAIVLLEDQDFKTSLSRVVYGCYRGREREDDVEIIYLNKELLTCSQYGEHSSNIIKYGAIILFTILHELGHWCFHHFSCNLNHDLATPKGVLMEEAGEAVEFLVFGFRIQHYGPEEPTFLVDDIVTKHNDAFRIIPINYLESLFKSKTYEVIDDSTSLCISMKQLKEAIILQEELSRFNCKRVFNPVDEPVLAATITNTLGDSSKKRIFHPCDKKV